MKSVFAGLLLAGTASLCWAGTGVATIKGTAEGSTVSGTVAFQDTKGGLKISAKLSGLPPGNHGFHIHEFGSCDDSAKAAGGHYNPIGSQHGFLPKDGIKKAHGGDMGNITVAADGTAQLELLLPKIALSDGKFNVGGRAVVVHEKADDFSQPVGNAGARIGCGPIVITGK